MKVLQDVQDQLFLNTELKDKDRVILEDLIYFKGHLQILYVAELQLEITECKYDSKVAGQFGQKKTLELISRNFYQPKMDKWINKYNGTWDTCQCMESPRHTKFGLLQPLEFLYSPWESILLDFIMALPESEGHTKIMVVVVDHFSKMAHFIALTKTTTAKDVA
jgi:hypothetical protein